MERTLVIGTGTGRDGTTSLSDLLSYQGLGDFPHELPEIPPHKDNLNPALHQAWLSQRMKRYEGPWSQPIRGEVSLSWSSWVPDLRHWAAREGLSIRFVFNRRDLEEVARSLVVKNGWEFDHWSLNLPPGQLRNCWSFMFPKVQAPTKEQAVREALRGVRRSLSQQFADDCVWMDVGDYNNEARCLQVLRWLGFERPRYRRFHSNKNE